MRSWFSRVGTTVIGGVLLGASVLVGSSATALVDRSQPDSAFTCVETLSGDVIETSQWQLSCDTLLDLAGHTLTVPGTLVADVYTLRVIDSVGGGEFVSNAASVDGRAGIDVRGSLHIRGGKVTARGGEGSAGIQVKAFGVQASGVAYIDGGTVNAYGGEGGAGIGTEALAEGGQIWILNGDVTATGGHYAAGIGGGNGSDHTHVRIEGGTVEARGGIGGAGIGGGESGDGGTISINGGTVLAYGGSSGAGLGGGYNGNGGFTRASGDYVEARGGNWGAGIGGGEGQRPGSIIIGGETFAASGGNAPAVGQGRLSNPYVPTDDDYLSVAGDLHLGSGGLTTDHFDESTVYADGRILTPAQDQASGSISGSRTLVNEGVIGLAADQVTAPVSVNHARVSFDVAGINPVTVFAPTFEAGLRNLPVPTQGVDSFAGWYRGDNLVIATTDLELDATGTPVPISLSARWASGSVESGLADDVELELGEPLVLPLKLLDGDGEPVDVDPSDWDIQALAGMDISVESGQVVARFSQTGTFNLAFSVTHDGETYSGQASIDVVAGAVADLTLTPSATEVDEGGTLTFDVDAFNSFGFSIGGAAADVVLTSSVATDVVDGLSVSFPTASPHTITATHTPSGTTAQVTIEVIPADSGGGPDSDVDDADDADAGADDDSEVDESSTLLATGSSRMLSVLLVAIVALATGFVLVRRRLV